jgi:hypothetical protein
MKAFPILPWSAIRELWLATPMSGARWRERKGSQSAGFGTMTCSTKESGVSIRTKTPWISLGQNRISSAPPSRPSSVRSVCSQSRTRSKRPVEVDAFGLAQPLGIVIPVGQFRVVEAAGVVEAQSVVTHASVSSSGWG